MDISFDIQNPIPIKELIVMIDKHDAAGEPIPFSIIAVTCNYAKNTGGEIVILEKSIHLKNVRLINLSDITIKINPYSLPKIPQKLSSRIRRIYNVTDDSIRNVNIRYITHFKFYHDASFRRITY